MSDYYSPEYSSSYEDTCLQVIANHDLHLGARRMTRVGFMRDRMQYAVTAKHAAAAAAHAMNIAWPLLVCEMVRDWGESGVPWCPGDIEHENEG